MLCPALYSYNFCIYAISDSVFQYVCTIYRWEKFSMYLIIVKENYVLRFYCLLIKNLSTLEWKFDLVLILCTYNHLVVRLTWDGRVGAIRCWWNPLALTNVCTSSLTKHRYRIGTLVRHQASMVDRGWRLYNIQFTFQTSLNVRPRKIFCACVFNIDKSAQGEKVTG